MSVDPQWVGQLFPSLSQLLPLRPGGQKWVFAAEHASFGSCVLKLMKPGGTAYLDRELEAVSRLSSPNVPRVFDVGTVPSAMGPLVWLLEERVDGADLTELLTHGPLDGARTLSLAVDVVSAATDAEDVKVVHRDIKPANIKVDTTGRAWLLDFGIARILDLESKTATGAVSGPHTPGYSAPEQFRYRKRSIDGRADLFAIGVVLYECATGSNPFLQGARDRLEVLRRVETMQLPPLSLGWDAGGEFAGFVSMLTQKYPHQRPASCAEALAWLRDIANQLGGLT